MREKKVASISFFFFFFFDAKSLLYSSLPISCGYNEEINVWKVQIWERRVRATAVQRKKNYEIHFHLEKANRDYHWKEKDLGRKKITWRREGERKRKVK